MAKFCGIIGYEELTELTPGDWRPKITERKYYGDLTRNYGKHDSSGNVNDDINIANEVSIIADPYAAEHFFAIRYLKFNTPKIAGVWKVNSVEVTYPRLILTLGGIWNGNTT